jgi:copper homeostasis protein
MMKVVEVCVSDISSAIEAIRGGATSLELCSNRIEGGCTPSYGFIEQCKEYIENFENKNIQLNVLIRPRPGNFIYTNIEMKTIFRDINASKKAGADG